MRQLVASLVVTQSLVIAANAIGKTVQIQKIALIGDPAPGGGKFTTSFGHPISSHGNVLAFNARIPQTGIFRWSAGTLERVVVSGDVAPGVPGATFFASSGNTFPNFTMNESGDLAFGGQITGPGVNSTNNEGIWLNDGVSTVLIARESAVAPGTSPTTIFNKLSATGSVARPRVDASGKVIFSAVLSGPDVTSTTSHCVYGFDNGLELRLRAGDSAPGVNAQFGFIFYEPGYVGGNFGLLGDINNQSGMEGTWLQSDESFELSSLIGMQVPGFPEGTTFSGFESVPITLLSDKGTIAVQATLAGPGIDNSNSRSIWLVEPGNMELVARQGMQAIGLAPGLLYGPMFPVSISTNGQCAFTAFLTGPGVTSANNSGLWVKTQGGISLVARAGDTPPGMTAPAAFSGFGLESQIVALNDRGQVVFSFGGGSGSDGVWCWTALHGLLPIAVPGAAFEISPGDIRVVTSAYIGAIDESLILAYSRNLDDVGWAPFRITFSDTSSGIFRARVPLYADINGDNAVSVIDLLAMIESWGPCPAGPHKCTADIAPIGGDGVVNVLDLLALIANWG